MFRSAVDISHDTRNDIDLILTENLVYLFRLYVIDNNSSLLWQMKICEDFLFTLLDCMCIVNNRIAYLSRNEVKGANHSVHVFFFF